MDKLTGSVRLFSAPAANNPIQVPAPTVSHFFSTGRILSFFPQVNKNGYTFFKEDIPQSMVDTLVGSTVDIQHVKKGYGITDPLMAGQNNTIIGAMTQAVTGDDGIYVLNKIERAVAKGFGYHPDDFAPGQLLGKLSQECDFSVANGEWITVDKKDPSKIVSTCSFQDGLAKGFPIAPDLGWAGSHMENGTMKYAYDDGNPVYMRVKPISFAGVGHVVDPADPSAHITKLAASALKATVEIADKMSAYLPGMDDAPYCTDQHVLEGAMDKTSDQNVFTTDFYLHPDLLEADVTKFENEPDDDDKVPNGHFAAVHTTSDYNNQKDGKPEETTKRHFRIKNDKGEFDRKRLIAAYRGLMGLRGNVETQYQLPLHVRAHALALVRHGLKLTNPKLSKGVSSQVKLVSGLQVTEAQEQEILANAEKHLLETSKLYSKIDLDTVKAEAEAAKAQIATLTAKVAELEGTVTTLTDEKTTLTAKVAEFTDHQIATTRYAELNEVLPFSEDDKKAETHAEYIKNLAKLSPESFQIEKQARIISKLTASHEALSKNVASTSVRPFTNPVPSINMGTAGADSKPEIVSALDLY